MNREKVDKNMPRAGGGKTMAAGSGSYSGMADPHLQPGGDFHILDLGNGNLIALCPECYAAARASILSDTQSAMGGEATNSVNWNGVNWNGVNWNGVNWNGVNWNG